MLIFHPLNQPGKLIDVHMLTRVGPLGVFALEKRAFRYQNPAFRDIIQLRKIDIARITDVRYDRYL